MLQRSDLWIRIEGHQAASDCDEKIMNFSDRHRGHSADQNVAEHAASDCHDERQKQNAKQIKPLLHASKSEPEKRAADDLATGELLLARNDFDGAREHFEDALRQSPENALAYLRLAESLRGLQRLDEARLDYRKYIELQPSGKYVAEAKKAISDIDWILGK